MKKILLLITFGLISSLSIFQVSAVKLKLKYNRDIEHNDKNKPPLSIATYLDQYLTVSESTITFTTKKQEACDFNIEEVVRTILGTAYYRISYVTNTVLVWDSEQEQLVLISKDENINPLKKQIQWLTVLRIFYFSNNNPPVSAARNPYITLEIE
jgi:hypothetical protein